MAARGGFSTLLSLLRSAHMLNYVLVGTLCVGPLLAYASARAPSAADVEAELRETRGAQLARIERATDKINTFWKVKRNSAEMEGVYAGLLHGGKGQWRRHYELGAGSALSDAEAAQSPELARMQRLLALPQTPEERKEAEAAEAERARAPPAGAAVVAAAAAAAAAVSTGAAATAAGAAEKTAGGVAATAAASAGAAPGEEADLAKGRRSWLPFN
jgi:hypothetical protein